MTDLNNFTTIQTQLWQEAVSADTSKTLAMLAIAVGTIIFGLLPRCLRLNDRHSRPLVISNLLCFGAGVLLATSLVHMLPEVREKLPSYAELVFCGGFFAVYLVDEIVHTVCGEAFQHNHNHHVPIIHAESRPTYGSISESQNLLSDSVVISRSTTIRHIENERDEAANSRICHTTHTEPCAQSSAGHTGLLVALCVHSILEGMAIGVQDTSTKVFVLVGAVCCHKFVVSFCLGVELCSTSGSRLRNHALAILIFAFGSVAGIGIGMALTDVQQIFNGTALQVLQALAAGTLLYVTVCEVLPREKAKWHLSSVKYAGLLQCFSVMVGFGAMTALSIFIVS